jgi:hypothetical protein
MPAKKLVGAVKSLKIKLHSAVHQKKHPKITYTSHPTPAPRKGDNFKGIVSQDLHMGFLVSIDRSHVAHENEILKANKHAS